MAIIQFYHTHAPGDDLEQTHTEIGIVGGSEANTRAALTSDLDAVNITEAGGTLGKNLGIEYASGGSYGSGRCGISVAVECDSADRSAVETAINGIYTARA